MINPYQTMSELIEEAISNQRAKDVIARRFGLATGKRETLEEIGQSYGITRERVRQIEEGGLKALSAPKILSYLEPTLEYIKSHLQEHGDLRREETLLNDLAFVCVPVVASQNNIAVNTKEKNEISLCQAALYLSLVLGQSFTREKEDAKFHPLWTINKKSIVLARKIIDYLARHFNKAAETLEFKELYLRLKEIDKNITEKAFASYIDASKNIDSNKFGQYGLSHWPEIYPRGVRDKAYLVLKQHGEPLHFREITEKINEHNIDHKRAQVETVHNELIKDFRFVLIGRGVYALSNWGYIPGTVSDVIVNILEEKGFLTKEEILKEVLGKRMIKENTILINLQNRKIFNKDVEGKYSLRKS